MDARTEQCSLKGVTAATTVVLLCLSIQWFFTPSQLHHGTKKSFLPSVCETYRFHPRGFSEQA